MSTPGAKAASLEKEADKNKQEVLESGTTVPNKNALKPELACMIFYVSENHEWFKKEMENKVVME
jgi:hypothetical protein